MKQIEQTDNIKTKLFILTIEQRLSEGMGGKKQRRFNESGEETANILWWTRYGKKRICIPKTHSAFIKQYQLK